MSFSTRLLLSNVYNYVLIQESGVRVTPAAKAAIDKIKASKDFRYGVFFVKNETLIDLESTGMHGLSCEARVDFH